tara:strand:- start:217 stop:483 length:267 start_codon:yes stop_codon:yes gene_type:complete
LVGGKLVKDLFYGVEVVGVHFQADAPESVRVHGSYAGHGFIFEIMVDARFLEQVFYDGYFVWVGKDCGGNEVVHGAVLLRKACINLRI